MGERANIAIDDGESTPVTHTFVPNGDRADVFAFRNFNASVPAASESITVLVKDSVELPQVYSIPGRKSQPRTVSMRMKLPTTYTDAVSGLTLTDFPVEVNITLQAHPRATEQQCENARVLASNLLINGGTPVTYAWDKGEHLW